MKKSLLYLLLLTVAFTSCQKEPSEELPDNSVPIQPNKGNRLSKIVYQYSPTDSVYTEFFYDNAGRWTGHRTTGDDFALFTTGLELRVIRNTTGIITQYTVTDLDAAGFPENTTYTVHYDVNAKRYTSRVSEYELNGSILVDSTVFVMNNGRLATQRFLYKEKASGIFLEVGKLEFVYDASGNPVNIDTYTANPQTGAQVKMAAISLQFDAKSAALDLGVEAFVTDQIYFASPNNVTQLSLRDMSDPAGVDEEMINVTYQYNRDNKPVSAEVSVDGGKIPVFFKFG
ncbi:hypothetical protein [Paracnuella aquatica]|uniref:hypothetical protein n=1 Tax=Paracnuella aquatica TaxID=2268757 RepID=UPI000DEF3DE3|nr:hypothetical protein [Paracnuella aquatica]RPD51960.1 hypothetical protein DRJ53_04590 [Paracnuella aquatica]